MLTVKSMSDREIVNELSSESLLNRVRRLLSQSAGEIEQACAQRNRIGPVAIRRMEFAAAEKIIDIVKSDHPPDAIPTMLRLWI